MKLAGVFYDGTHSEAHPVEVDVEGRQIRVAGTGIERTWPLSAVRISPRIGETPRHLYFPDGSQCDTADNDGVDLLFPPGAASRAAHRLERSITYALLALGVTALLAWALITYAIPAVAKVAAFRLPDTTLVALGEDTLKALDEAFLGPTSVAPERQAHVRRLFETLQAAQDGARARLEFRKGRALGANALALPSGVIVVTDELLALATDDAEIMAVLAHELGHLRYRHALRSLLQSSATALIFAFAVGDVTSITSLAATLPTFLLQAKYSRAFETEADDFALAQLAARGIPHEAFASILERMERASSTAPEALKYLSTHPSTRERAARARAR